ncbi:DUF1642 domain-containing protein [Streptococcus hyovaginalis]|uniref:DUF1642 domain-containing protein n=1 Tax=Streptococcus hyovaginalis TaxID=149015 RepID=UPI0014793DE5|nr:DUF1642 domain-containing protein [Streptococcus hyovaginalis]
MNTQEAIDAICNLKTNDGWVNRYAVVSIVDQIEPEKPVVPQVAIDYYEQYKDNLLSFSEWFDGFYEKQFLEEFQDGDKLQKWLHDNDYKTNRQRELALATLLVNGVEAVQVEQEKMYTVEIPNPNNTSPKYKLMLVKGINGIEILRDYHNEKSDRYISQLTEEEIRKDFEWAWQWAKPVEE